MIERAVSFGETSSLVGILTEPDPQDKVQEAPMAVFLNSGIIHRVGASRLYVQIARRLARDGFTSLRFDYSGIGDSGSRTDSLAFKDSAVLETQDAMTWLERAKGGPSFVLMGLCSGADMAYFVALEDQRVVGLVQLDPFAYRTRKWYLRHYGPRLFSLSSWTNALRARAAAIMDRLRPEEDDGSDSVYVPPEYRRVFPPREQIEEGLGRLSARGVSFFVCITGNEEAINYEEQYRESFREVDFGELLTVDYLSEADHTFTGVGHQEFVVERIGGWFREGYAGASMAV